MKILILDIEISPVLATVWGLFNQNIGLQHIIGQSSVMCWSAKWHGDDFSYYSSTQMTDTKSMLKAMHELLDEADAVVTYNGNRFDLPVLNKEFLLHGFKPPSPYHSIDVLATMRRRFRFTSNKLAYVAQQLGCTEKLETGGHQLWLDCMNGDKEAWRLMEEYNTQDVYTLEEVYDKVLPWINNHPNHSLYDEAVVCTNCGSTHIHWEGYRRTKTRKYRRAQCNSCGTWLKSNKSEPLENKEVLTNAS